MRRGSWVVGLRSPMYTRHCVYAFMLLAVFSLRIKADCFYKGGKSVNLSMEIAYEMNHIHELLI